MIDCEISATGGSEWTGCRCKRTGADKTPGFASQVKSKASLLKKITFAVLLLGDLVHEFVRVSQAIIHFAAELKNYQPP